MHPRFDVQGHRGARGLRPENTLPGFELAFDLGVTSIETDVHLTKDHVPVLIHDPALPDGRPVAQLSVAELPVALQIPTLSDLFTLAKQKAAAVRLDLELKRVPFLPETIGDDYDGTAAGILERKVLEAIDVFDMRSSVSVRSFDHRCVRFMKQLCPGLRTAVLVAYTAPVRPLELLEAAGADVYCPEYHFVDAAIVRQVHDAGKTVLPWTVNDTRDWERLIAWGVDGITTDYPDRLLAWLSGRAR